ncbi:beta-ketoacyl-ACP synthase [Oscillatoria sp. CS-180]|uniref:beta-ketoacyl-ACP synthase n=1 Tax=Oscillatoria sp. CS-180 TaxID=3021720 RepID=UPI00232E7814|nr:beta-ketoacyl-ACP synthase [Oscillatoria sp. CS-180]MDB9525451.1 beta-ketoacyl-ACP synthase [Oscillatoria sp. CS-180]
MTVVVTGIGLVSALGTNTENIWQRLLGGESAIALRQPFQSLSPRPMAMIGKQPSHLDDLLLQATRQAVQDAGLSMNLPECGVVLGSSRGHQAQWEKGLVDGAIEGWLSSLPHMAAIAIARQVGSQGPVLAPTAACATGLWAIAQGASLVRSGQCDQVLVGAGEAAITPLTIAGFEQMRALAQTGCYPFDEQREGLVLGEGAAVLLLESQASAEVRSANVYGEVLGVGLTADANHISAPDNASYEGGLAAIRTCLAQSDLTPDDISFIHAHGTGTRLNDAYESTLIQSTFSPDISVTGTKGATGHTLGASGVIGAAVCLLALKNQILPPCVGLKTPAFELNFVRQAYPSHFTNALCFGFGFGGQNAVIAFGYTEV